MIPVKDVKLSSGHYALIKAHSSGPFARVNAAIVLHSTSTDNSSLTSAMRRSWCFLPERAFMLDQASQPSDEPRIISLTFARSTRVNRSAPLGFPRHDFLFMVSK